jgi:hypothetical protein
MSAVSNHLFAIEREEEYLCKNVLHFKPLCSYIFTAVGFVGTTLYQASLSKPSWKSKTIQGISKGVFVTGNILNSLVALVEFVISATICIFVQVGRETKYPFLEKHSAKVSAHTFNTLRILSAQLEMLWKRIFWEEFAHVKKYDKSSYLQSAVQAQLFMASSQHEKAGERQVALNRKRAVQVLVEALPWAMPDIFSANYQQSTYTYNFTTRELREVITNGQIMAPHANDFQEFIEKYPNHQTLVESWKKETDVKFDPFEKMLKKFGFFLLLKQRGALAKDPDQVTPQEANYRTELKNFIKQGYKEIYQNFAALIADNNDLNTGKSMLKSSDPEVFIPLTLFSALKEIEAKNICCPSSFPTEILQSYNGRHNTLVEAREKLGALQPEEKNLLIQKLLKPRSFSYGAEITDETKSQVDALFKLITLLAEPLHQGKLMCEQGIDRQTLESFNRNFLQEAYQEAMSES